METSASLDVNKIPIVDDLHNIFGDVLFPVQVFALRILAFVYLVNETPFVSFAVVSSSPQRPTRPGTFGF